jgi:class I fructose-bisphosphate aldolase
MEIEKLLEEEAAYLLEHQCATITKENLHLPGPDFIDRVLIDSDRTPRVLGSLQQIFGHGRLCGPD